MQQTIDIRVLELLASRLCHDLVGPVGAVNNGLELLEEDDEMGLADEAVGLVRVSARQAADALQFYRMAYGMAGSQVGSDLTELGELARRYLGSERVDLDWRVSSQPEDLDGLGKLLLNLAAFAVECLPRGGRLLVESEERDGTLAALVTAEGEGCKIREESLAALDDAVDVGSLTPRSVQGFFIKRLVHRFDGVFNIDEGQTDRLVFEIRLARP
jgi:histidine phosphotransferase ChpT